MKKFVFSNDNNNVYAVKWDKVDDIKAIVVVVHGMAEHIERYNYFASILNTRGYLVYGYEVIGHGSCINGESIKGHWNKGDFNRNVENIHSLISFVKNENPNSKVFIFAHSMGTFLTKQYMYKYGNNINGVILSGTTSSNFLMKIGYLIARFYSKNKDKIPNKTMNKLSFGGYNKSCKPTKTEFDWLSTDEEQVKKYVDDPLCGFICTTGYYKEFTASLKNLDKKSNIALIPKKLPIYLFCGANDPVSSKAKGVEKLYNLYLKQGINNVNLKIYDGKRHEMINEVNKDDVIKDVINWLNKQTIIIKYLSL